MGCQQVWLEADAPRVRCRDHGPTVAAVPWARHDAGHTRDFDDTVAWLAVQCSKTAITELMGVAWRTVGSIITRVQVDIDASVDRLDGLHRIGIDEISYKRGHRFLTVVVDHDTGRLVWADVGKDEATLHRFFDLLGEERCAQITQVSADAASWIANVVAERCPSAVRCADPFHIVRWATPRLHRAYLLKEGLRTVFALKGQAGKDALDHWISWARRTRIPTVVGLQKRIVQQRAAIDATLDQGLSNALIESTNTKIRLLTRIAFGFKNPQALIALALLALGGHRPALPGRN